VSESLRYLAPEEPIDRVLNATELLAESVGPTIRAGVKVRG